MLLLLAVSTALVAAAAQTPSQAYESNKEYLYEYETQALTGIPMGSTIYSGMKMKSDVRIQFRSRSSATLKMDKLTFAKINDPIESVDPTQQQVPAEMFKPLTGRDAEQMLTDLSRPINFRYVRGNVRDIHHEADDPEWSVNVKKGLLSMLEMNLEKRKELRKSGAIPQVLRPQSSDEGSMFTVMEPSIVGECETLYRISPWTSTSGNPSMHITKVRNYQHCMDRPKYFASMFHLRQCAECVREQSEPLRSASQIRYTLRGNMRLFQIQSAIAESQHVFTPYSAKGGHVATYLNQTLNLVKEEDVKTSLSEPQSPTKAKSGLQYTSRELELRDSSSIVQQSSDSRSTDKASPESPQHPSSSSSQNPSPQPPSLQPKTMSNQAADRIRKLLKMLEVFMKPTIQPEAGPLLMSLLEEIRTADSESLRAVYREVFQTAKTDSKQFKMLMDILPSAGTTPATEVLVDSILNDQLPQSEAVVALGILSLSARPDVLIAKKLLDLTKSSQVSKNRYLKRAAFLCLGSVAGMLREEGWRRSREISRQEEIVKTLISQESRSQTRNELKSKKRDLEDLKRRELSINTKIKQEIVKELQMLMRSTVFDDKILSFKTIGNAGLWEMIPTIRTYIQDKSQPQMLRTQAIYSLRKLARHYPDDIQTTLLPLYFDQSEKEEVRIGSYLVMTFTEPTRQLLEMVAQSLHRERNPHVGTFVYTHLEQMSNSTYPCLMSWAKNATFAMRFAKKFSPMYHYSRFMHLSGFNDMYKMGAAAELGLVTTPEEFIPRAGAVNLNTYVFGRSVNLAEIGFNTEGLQTLVSKLVGPLGELTKGKSLVDVLKQRVRRSAESAQPSDPISQIHKQLKVSPRTSPTPKGHMYMKMMGNELQYITLDGTLVDTLLREGKLLSGVSEQDLKTGLNVEVHRSTMPLDAEIMIPSECGLPLRLKLHGTAAIKVTGKVGVTGIPSIFEINRPGKQAEELSFNFELRPSVLFHLRGEMEMDAEYFKMGVALKTMAHMETPLSLTASANLPKAKFYTKFNVEKLSEKIARLEVSPYTYFKEDPSEITKYPLPREMQEISVAKNAKVYPMSMAYGKQTLGLEIKVSGQAVVRDFEMNVPYYPMIGKQEMIVTLSPGTDPQKYVEIQFQLMKRMSQSKQQPTSEESSSSTGLLSWVSSLIGNDQSDQSSPSSSSSSSSSPPKDIRSKDTSLKDLLEHLKELQSVHPDGSVVTRNNSMGLIFNIIGIDESRSIKRHFHISMAAGMNPSSTITSILLRMNRSPIPTMETKPWNMDVAVNVNLPSRLADPSELLSDAYQRELEQQIEVYVRRHGESDYHRWIQLEEPRRESSVLQRLLSLSDTQEVIDEVMNSELSKSEESATPEDRNIIDLIRKQKQILKEARKILQRSYDSLRVQDIKAKLSSLIKRSESVRKDLEKDSASVSKSEKSDALRKYCALLQQLIDQKLDKAVRSSRRSLSSKERQDIAKSLESSKESLRKILQQQHSSPSKEVSSTSPPSSVRIDSSSVSESDSEEVKDSSRSASKESRKPEQKDKSQQQQQPSQQSQDTVSSKQPSQGSSSLSLSKSVSDLLQKQRDVVQDISRSKESEGLKSVDEKKIKEALRLAKEVAEKIRQENSGPSPRNIEKERQRIVKSVIQQQQIMKCLEQRVKKSQTASGKSKDQIKEIQKIMQEIKQENNRLSKIAATSSQQKREKEEATIRHSQGEQDTLSRLRQVQMSQVIAAQQLAVEEQGSKTDQSKRIQQIREVMNTLGQTESQIRSIVSQKSVAERPVDVVRKLVEVSHMQHSLLGLVAERARDELVRSVSRSEAKDSEIETLKKRAESKQVDCLQMLRSIMTFRSLKRTVSSLSGSERQSLKRLHSEVEDIRSKQIEIEKNVRKIDQDKEKSAKKPDSATIQDLVSKSKAVQDKVQKIESDIKSLKLHQKVADTTIEPQQRIEVQKNIVEKIKKMIPDSSMSSQEKESAKVSVTSQLSKLEEVKKKLQELKREESQEKVASPSQSSQQSQSPVTSQPSSRIQNLEPSARGELRAKTGREVCISIKAEYGSEGETKKLFDVQILGTPSLEQILWEKSQRSPLERSSITKRYLETKRNGSEEVTSDYLRLRLEMNMIRHLHVRAHWEKNELPRVLEEYIWRTHEAFKAMMYGQMYTEYPHSFRPKDRLEILFDLRRNNRQFDTELKLPEESNFIRGMWMPYFGPFMFESVQSIRDGVHRSFPESTSSITSRLPGQCEMKHSQIRTMDGKEYSIPDTKECEVIMAMDCSSSKHFAIKTKMDSSDSTKRVVEVHIEGKKLEIVPVDSSLVVRVDGQVRQVPEESSITVSESTGIPSTIKVSRSQRIVSVIASQKGVRVSSDGRKVSLKISPFYYSQTCGLCGNFDGKQENEFQSPSRTDRSDSSCLVLDYLVPDSKCDSQSIRKECQQPQTSSSRCQMESKTIRRTRLHKGESQLCLSQEPVKSCPSQCKPVDPKSTPVRMACFPHDSAKAKELERDSFKRPLDLKAQQADYTEYVQVPRSCGEM